MEHSSPCRTSGIQIKKFTDSIVKICYIKTMLIATGFAVMGIFFHLQHIRVMNQILDVLIKLLISRILHCSDTSSLPVSYHNSSLPIFYLDSIRNLNFCKEKKSCHISILGTFAHFQLSLRSL